MDKAFFKDMNELWIVLSFHFTFPKMIRTPRKTSNSAANGGCCCSHQFNSTKIFIGDFWNGNFQRTKKALNCLMLKIHNSINKQLPAKTHMKHNNSHTTHFLDSLLPLYETLHGWVLLEKYAWDRVFVYVKALFEEICTKKIYLHFDQCPFVFE